MEHKLVRPINVLALDSKDLAAHARNYAPVAIATAVEIMGNAKAKDLARLRACSLILAYGHGLPVQNVRLSGGIGGGGSNSEDEEFREILRKAAESTARALSGGATLLGAGYTEITAQPQPAPVMASNGQDQGGQDQGEVLAPISQDHETLRGKDQLTAMAVGMAVASGLKRQS